MCVCAYMILYKWDFRMGYLLLYICFIQLALMNIFPHQKKSAWLFFVVKSYVACSCMTKVQ